MSILKKTFLKIILVNVTLFFALISIHEISHVMTGYLLGCELGRAILFDSSFNGPHTELICSNFLDEIFVYLGSFAITSAFSLSILFLESSLRSVFPVSLGISTILSSLDISLALNLQSTLYPLLTFGFLLVAAGEYSITSSYMKERFSIGLNELEEEI